MPDASSFAAMDARLQQLERQIRTLKRLLFASLVLGIVLVTGAGTFAQQHALSFTGKYGKVVVDGSGLHIKNKAGKELALIGYTSLSDVPAIRYYDSSGADRMYVGLSSSDDGLVRMWAKSGQTSLDLGNGTLAMYDPSGTKRFSEGLTTENTGSVVIWNSSGKVQSELQDDYLRIGDSGGTERTYLGVTTTNESVFQTYDQSHTERSFSGTYNDGTSGFAAYNSAGTATWSSP